ncbi:5-formyltetrahydrofolate cyclo-ligase-like protein COG0212 (Protein CLUSTERS OF ORTHOLOGOUS GROUP 212) [Durusdinium trenchii]|uniref:5-formyltetrahydrofolate cyclo-ligase-like protein COG0212 (Protein CLUSTERS OF ORTHOLOGOUS GROUP 212) n=1 Tax=Durusdinium trenchii TaxID=1381693 RepID=A0ABP0SHE0_9DINO
METEEDRLRLDQQSRDRMAAHMKAVEEAEAAGSGDRGAWKWKIRQRIWDYMEENDIAANPRPVHHRIPNFVNAELTAKQVAALPEFQSAKWVKVNPDRPQSEVRATVLRSGKMLLVPQPRLRTGFFSVLDPAKIPMDKYGYACTQAGVVAFGEPIDLDAKLKVDMVIIGSVAVNPANGARIGKGEGFAELEYGMLRLMGAIDDTTPVVSCIHDCQLVDDIPSEQLLCHDVPVDIICTPTRTIRVPPSLPKPTGIYWDKLSPQKLGSILILQKLKAKLEQETGQRLPSGPDEILPPTARRDGKGKGGKGGKGKKGKDEGRGERKGEKGKERKGDGRKGKASREQDALRMVKDTRTGYGSKGRVGKDFQGCNC